MTTTTTSAARVSGTIKPLADALEWYGERARLARLIHDEGDSGRQALAHDGGQKAREALAAIQPDPEPQPVACPCTQFEQDESCPVGYPSLICGVCNGTGHTTLDNISALAVEMLRIASDLGEAEDPFAAWEALSIGNTDSHSPSSAGTVSVEALIDALHCCGAEAGEIANRIAGKRGKPCQHPDGVQVLEDAETIIRAALRAIAGEDRR